jgi:hypothetical protein
MLKAAIKGIIISCAISSGAFAQEVFKLNSFGGGFNVMLGYQGYNPSSYFSDKTGIGDELTGIRTSGNLVTTSTATFNKPSSGVLNMGFQGFGVFNSFMLGGELNFNLGTPSESEHKEETFENGVLVSSANKTYKTTSRLAGADVLVNLGFVALRKRGLIVYPMVGFGYGMSGLLLSSDAPNRLYPGIASVVTESDPNLQNIFIWTRTPMFDFGLGAQYMLGASTEDRAKGFSVGLRMGYKLQPQSNTILVNANKNVADGLSDEDKKLVPNVGLSGFYVKLLIGFGKIGE